MIDELLIVADLPPDFVMPLSTAPLVTLGVIQPTLGLEGPPDGPRLPPGQDEEDADRRHHQLPGESRWSLNVSTIMAGLTLATLPIITVYIFGQRYFVRGLVAGALKGE